MELDPRTLIISASVSAFMMAIVLLFLARSLPPSIQGPGAWGAGYALFFLSALATGLRGLIPNFLSIVIANLALEVGIALVYAGLCRFNKRRVPSWPLSLLLTLVVLLLIYFTYGEDSTRVRIIIVSSTNVLLIGLCLAAIIKARPGHALQFGEYFTACILFAEIAIFLSRAVYSAWVDTGPTNLLSTVRVQQIYLAGYAISALVMGVGLVLMAHDRLKEELQYLASHDNLTGAFNRRALIDLAEREHARSQRSGQSMALLMIDLDHFKNINDGQGHQMGDRVLRRFVEVTQDCLRRQDILGRFGGEEFMVLLPDTPLATARMVAERICATVAAAPVQGKQGDIRVTVSIGVAAGGHDTSLDQLTHAADAAMYNAKAAGRNRVETAADA